MPRGQGESSALISFIIMHRLDKGLENLGLHSRKTNSHIGLHIVDLYFPRQLF